MRWSFFVPVGVSDDPKPRRIDRVSTNVGADYISAHSRTVSAPAMALYAMFLQVRRQEHRPLPYSTVAVAIRRVTLSRSSGSASSVGSAASSACASARV